jgi:hypothetical protein
MLDKKRRCDSCVISSWATKFNPTTSIDKRMHCLQSYTSLNADLICATYIELTYSEHEHEHEYGHVTEDGEHAGDFSQRTSFADNLPLFWNRQKNFMHRRDLPSQTYHFNMESEPHP